MSDTPLTDGLKHNMGSVQEPHFVVDADFARRLERDRAALIRGIKETLPEIRWFVARQKDLATHVDSESERTWADVLDEDCAPLRALLTELGGK